MVFGPSGAHRQPCGPPRIPRNPGGTGFMAGDQCSTVGGAVDLRGHPGDGMTADGQLVAGRDRVVRRLAVGGMSRVWLAVDELLDRRVVIKQCVLPDGLDD